MLFRSLALLAVLMTAPAALAQPQSRPCLADLRRLCPGVGLNREALTNCLLQNLTELSPACRASVGKRAGASPDTLPAGATERRYGTDPLQSLDYLRGEAEGARPLVIFIHGGGWAIGDKRSGSGAKAAFFTSHGYRYASINYRLAPRVDVATQAADVAAAIADLRKDAGALGIDPDRIALVGHSAGAHLAALVGTDPKYLEAAGVPLSVIRAVSLLDGAAYDVPRQVRDSGSSGAKVYTKVFTTDPAVQTALSPATYAGAPNAAAFILHYDAGRAAAVTQADLLARALAGADTRVSVKEVANSNHLRINREFGMPGDPVSKDVLTFFEKNL